MGDRGWSRIRARLRARLFQHHHSLAARVRLLREPHEVQPGLHENGKLVVGESIADLGGLVVAYAAFQRSMEGKPRPKNIDGFTPEQRFFLAFARVWAGSVRPETERLLVNLDPHPLGRFRGTAPLTNMPQFAAAFQCKEGDKMVRPAKDRCVIW